MIYRPDIDGLRALAVLPVVLYHAGIPGLSGGYIGVDVFFVISGYLITAIVAREIAQGDFSLAAFYERRARRILPALVVVVFFSFLAGWVLLLPQEMKSLGQSAVATAAFLSNVYFMLRLDYFAPAAEFAPLLHTWSLAVEEQFYLFFPPLLYVLAVWFGKRAVLPAVIVVSLASFLAAVVMLRSQPDEVFYLIFYRAWELGAGAALALAALNAPRVRAVREALGVLALLAILVPVFSYDEMTPFPGMAAVPPVLGATLLIWIGGQGGGSFVTRLLAWRSCVWLGLISYSLYLWHWPVLSFLRIIQDSVVIPLPQGLAAVALSIAAAWLSYRFVEQPFRRKRTRGFSRRQVFVISLASVCAIAAFGLFTHTGSGLPGRLPDKVVEIAQTADDRNPRRAECFGRRPTDELCRIGAADAAPGSETFLFWGDSHADAMMPGMARAAEEAGQTGLFAGHSACPPIVSVQRKYSDGACPSFNQDVRAWLDTHPEVRLVILGARWALSVEGTRYLLEAGSRVDLEWTGTLAASVTKDNASIVDAGLRETIGSLRAADRDVVLLGPVPEIGRNAPTAIARATILGWSSAREYDVQMFHDRARRTEEMLRTIAADYEGVRYLALSDLFCGETTCRITGDDGLPLYVDDDHISQQAARQLLAPRLLEIWQHMN